MNNTHIMIAANNHAQGALTTPTGFEQAQGIGLLFLSLFLALMFMVYNRSSRWSTTTR